MTHHQAVGVLLLHFPVHALVHFAYRAHGTVQAFVSKLVLPAAAMHLAWTEVGSCQVPVEVLDAERRLVEKPADAPNLIVEEIAHVGTSACPGGAVLSRAGVERHLFGIDLGIAVYLPQRSVPAPPRKGGRHTLRPVVEEHAPSLLQMFGVGSELLGHDPPGPFVLEEPLHVSGPSDDAFGGQRRERHVLGLDGSRFQIEAKGALFAGVERHIDKSHGHDGGVRGHVQPIAPAGIFDPPSPEVLGAAHQTYGIAQPPPGLVRGIVVERACLAGREIQFFLCGRTVVETGHQRTAHGNLHRDALHGRLPGHVEPHHAVKFAAEGDLHRCPVPWRKFVVRFGNAPSRASRHESDRSAVHLHRHGGLQQFLSA